MSTSELIEVPVAIPGSPCRIFVGLGLLAEAGRYCANQGWGSSCALISDEIVARLTACCGQRGRNREYALRTWRSLADHGVHCPHLGRVGRRLLAAGCD